MDRDTLKTVRKKHKMYRRWIETRDGQHYQEYIKARNKATRECRKAKIRLEKTVAEQAKKNPKSFWSYVKAKTSTRTGISDLNKNDGTTARTDEEKAQVLNDFFQSVFTEEPEGELPEAPVYEFNNPLTDIEVDIAEVQKLLKNLKNGKAAGPDDIPTILLSETAEALALPVSIIFRKSLDEGQLPNIWKKAKVTPIFKKGSRASANNYRPVSLTCILCKVMETLIRNRVLNHMQQNKLICKEQHGFTPGRSCVTQLLDTLDCWTETLDNGGAIDAIYMDFRKAFDSVPHRRLIHKTNSHGIQGLVLKWIEAFLGDRSQQVFVNGSKSQEGRVTSGIPQGSVLGPILFVIYINDLPNQLESEVRIFADDTKLFTQSNDEKAREVLQADLDRLHQWSVAWLLNFHPEKCCTLKLGNPASDQVYYMQSKETNEKHALAASKAEKDLGVIVDSQLTFKDHISQSTTKANKILGVIRRSFDHLTNDTFVQLYKALVRPILEYGHSVWQPALKSLQKDIEDVQRRATKLISSLKDKPYQERLATLKLPSLEHRRRRGDMIDLFKYVSNIYDTSRPNFIRNVDVRTRGHSRKLMKNRSRLLVRSNFFSERVISVWNNLPESVVAAPSVNAFKNRLDAHWANHPALYNPECYN